MPKAEKGTPKDLANRMKSRGLQKLAFYCQVCEKQMRDQNGFKQHCASEPHVRMMLLVGQNPSKAISEYSRQFKHDFLQLLRTAHGEKRIQANHFYQEYIQNKSHIHMNGTHWKKLSEFVKGLGREGICRVDDGEKGLFISWIDNSPEALSRQAAIRKKDKQDKGDEERANQLIAEQIERAQAESHIGHTESGLEDQSVASGVLQRSPSQKIKISFGSKNSANLKSSSNASSAPFETGSKAEPLAGESAGKMIDLLSSEANSSALPASNSAPTKKANVFAARKSSSAKSGPVALPRPTGSCSLGSQGLSNAQQIILEDQERQRRREVYQKFKEDESKSRQGND